MTAFLRWYVVVQCLGLLGFFLARPAFARLPDRGYTFGKIFGLLLCGGTLWLGTALGLLRNGPGGATIVLVALSSAAAIALWRQLTLLERRKSI